MIKYSLKINRNSGEPDIYIGSLLDNGHQVTIIDNLVNGAKKIGH